MFLYWGRRGLSRFALEVARAALANEKICATISVSRQNENFSEFRRLGQALLPVSTFATSVGALMQIWRIPIIRERLRNHLAAHRPQVVIELMPHVWSSFIAPVIKASGVRYVTIVHDADPHPGDYRSASIQWLAKRTLLQADLILTLSDTVATRVQSLGQVSRGKVVPVFHPDLDFGSRHTLPPPRPGDPLRLAFFGRIMPYKGLPLFLDAVDQLSKERIAVQVGVFGEGALGAATQRLSAMGAEVVNRWQTETEIGAIFARYHAIILSHTEASQSGVAAAAFGAGLPVVATPVGGLIEQVHDGINGVLALRPDARSLAEATKRLLFDPQLYRTICQNLAATKHDRSVARFVEQVVWHSLNAGRAPASTSSAPSGARASAIR
jgi:glycosyltransferase involved in cell wall biosynthesis